ncbi:MAG: BolA family transcriptional regulator [bacterium]|nr:BolA family transcriptional regulator [bacterium]
MSPLERVKTKIVDRIPGSEVTVKDVTGGENHLEITVVSKLFEGKRRIERHRMVLGALKSELEGALHAVRVRALIPADVGGVQERV